MELLIDQSVKDNNKIYGSFLLNGCEFAVPVSAIQEVVNEPNSYSAVPLAPDYLLGIFNLRGMIIPVVDLMKIFNFPNRQSTGKKKIGIIEHGNHCIGILFDQTCEVFNESNLEKINFSIFAKNNRQKVIEGVFKKSGTEELVQVLNPYELLNLKNLPQTEDLLSRRVKKVNRGKKEQCVSFQVGDSTCALNMECIQEIVKVESFDNTVLSNDICIGAIKIRGNTIPIINFELVLGYESNFSKENSNIHNYPIIIMRLDEELFGLVVNSVESIISYYQDQLISFPILSESKQEIFMGCLKNADDSQTILLDHAQVISNSEVYQITKGHEKICKEKRNQQSEEAKGIVEKETYLTFSIGDQYAVKINEVREVIDHPDKIIHPPNISEKYKGVINLRGEMIPIIDPRELCVFEQNSDVDEYKILIFSHSKNYYGLVVDTVDSIVTFRMDERVKLPDLFYKTSDEKSLNKYVKTSFEISDGSTNKQSFFILDLDLISSPSLVLQR